MTAFPKPFRSPGTNKQPIYVRYSVIHRPVGAHHKHYTVVLCCAHVGRLRACSSGTPITPAARDTTCHRCCSHAIITLGRVYSFGASKSLSTLDSSKFAPQRVSSCKGVEVGKDACYGRGASTFSGALDMTSSINHPHTKVDKNVEVKPDEQAHGPGVQRGAI